MDYGQSIQFGYFLTPDAAHPQEVVALARLCDRLGFDLIGIQDHPYQSRFFDTWTLLAFLAAQTTKARFFPDVANLPLRPPVMLAKSAASLDLLSGGRVELGLGAGAFQEGVRALGGSPRAPAQAVKALEEAIEVIRLFWSGQRGVRYEGQYYQLQGAHSGPVPAHKINLWIGAYGPKMLNLTGRTGDGWVPSSSYAPPTVLPGMQSLIDEGAQSAGRSPSSIRRIYNVMGQIVDQPSGQAFQGPPEQWVDELTDLALNAGMDTFILGLPDPPGGQLERFMADIAPRVRENVAAHRQASAVSQS